MRARNVYAMRDKGFSLFSWLPHFFHSASLIAQLFLVVSGDEVTEKLLNTLFSDYEKTIRPVENHDELVKVGFGLKLTKILDVEWYDYKLKWNHSNFGGLKEIEVPSQNIWLPDIVLYNNVEGNYLITHLTKATLYSNGRVVWEPPAIYKSYCAIDIQYFPYDIQKCEMKFSPWSYNANLVEIFDINDVFYNQTSILDPIDISQFTQSVAWDLTGVSARKNILLYPCCPEVWADITYAFIIRRKTLYYNVNLVFPCVIISLIESREKITLCISVQVTLTVYFSLLVNIIPPNCIVVPLISKYLLFTMILVTFSIVLTVFVLNVNFRTPNTHVLSPKTRKIFLNILPKYLFISLPKTTQVLARDESTQFPKEGRTRHRMSQREKPPAFPKIKKDSIVTSSLSSSPEKMLKKDMALEMAKESIRYIGEYIRYQDRVKQIKEEWKYIALVLDRLFLWIFSAISLLGTLAILLNAPTYLDSQLTIGKKTVYKSYEI